MRIDLNSSDLRFLSRHADRLAGLPISVGNRRDDSGAWLGTFRHARVYLAGKPVRLDGPGDGCTCVEIRGNAAGPVEAEQLAEAVALWPLAVAAVARHIEGRDPAAWVERALAEGPFRAVRHPGNHTYVWPVDGRRDTTRGLAAPCPRPKSVDATP